MKNALTTGLNLLALQNSRVEVSRGEEGIFIPFRKKGVNKIVNKDGKTGAFLNIFHLPKEDAFGNDYMVTRSRTKDESDAGTYTEVLGNAKEIRKGRSMSNHEDREPQQEQKKPSASKTSRKDDEDDVPF